MRSCFVLFYFFKGLWLQLSGRAFTQHAQDPGFDFFFKSHEIVKDNKKEKTKHCDAFVEADATGAKPQLVSLPDDLSV